MALLLLGGVAAVTFILFLVHEVRVEAPKRQKHYADLERSGKINRKM